MNARRRILAGLAMTLVVAGWIAIFLIGKGQLPSSDEAGAVGGADRQRLTALTKSPLKSATPTRTIAIRPAVPEKREFDPYEEWNSAQILGAFGVPPGKFEGATMGEIVEHLEQVFADNGGRGIEFRVEGQGGFPVSCEFGNVSASELMDLVAGLGGYQLSIGEGEVVFRRRPQATGNLAEQKRFFDGQLFFDPDSHNQETLAGQFAAAGIELAEDVSLDSTNGRFMLTGPAEQLDRAAALVEFMGAGQTLGVVSIEMKRFSLDEPVGSIEAQTFSAGEDAREAVDVLVERGASVTAMPRLMARAGQSLTIESVREIYFPSGEGENDYEARQVGAAVELQPVILGLDRIGVSGLVEQSGVDEGALQRGDVGADRPGQLIAGSVDDLQVDSTLVEGQLFDGNTAQFQSGAENGESLVRLMTVQRMRLDGTAFLPATGEEPYP